MGRRVAASRRSRGAVGSLASRSLNKAAMMPTWASGSETTTANRMSMPAVGNRCSALHATSGRRFECGWERHATTAGIGAGLLQGQSTPDAVRLAVAVGVAEKSVPPGLYVGLRSALLSSGNIDSGSARLRRGLGFRSVGSQALQIPHDQSGKDVLVVRFVDFPPRLWGEAVALQVFSRRGLGDELRGLAAEVADQVDGVVGVARTEALVFVADAGCLAAEALGLAAAEDGGPRLSGHGGAQVGQVCVNVEVWVADPVDIIGERVRALY